MSQPDFCSRAPSCRAQVIPTRISLSPGAAMIRATRTVKISFDDTKGGDRGACDEETRAAGASSTDMLPGPRFAICNDPWSRRSVRQQNMKGKRTRNRSDDVNIKDEVRLGRLVCLTPTLPSFALFPFESLSPSHQAPASLPGVIGTRFAAPQTRIPSERLKRGRACRALTKEIPTLASQTETRTSRRYSATGCPPPTRRQEWVSEPRFPSP